MEQRRSHVQLRHSREGQRAVVAELRRRSRARAGAVGRILPPGRQDGRRFRAGQPAALGTCCRPRSSARSSASPIRASSVPARQSVAASRLAPMEFVETLAALYQKSGAAHIAVEIVYEQFRGALATPLLGSHRMPMPRRSPRPSPIIFREKTAADTRALIRRIEDAVGNPASARRAKQPR